MIRWTSTEATEHQIQAAYFELLKRHVNQAPILQYIYAIPNGGLRDVKVAVKLKREGVKRGVPDVSIPIPRDNYHGAYIEFKTPTGALSKDTGASHRLPPGPGLLGANLPLSRGRVGLHR